MPVGFFDLFSTTVPVDIAFPGQTPNPGLVTLLNLEIWGVPTSQPTPDPNNQGFIYQRFQRGIMHHRSEANVTEGILVADYLKSVMTTRNLPPDLAEDMRTSRYFNQYDPSSPNWVRRPAELPNTNLTGAFEPGSGDVQAPAPAPSAPVTVPVTAPAPAEASVTIQLNDTHRRWRRGDGHADRERRARHRVDRVARRRHQRRRARREPPLRLRQSDPVRQRLDGDGDPTRAPYASGARADDRQPADRVAAD
jgi:hypothetical protein